jgi:hypothetical protein
MPRPLDPFWAIVALALLFARHRRAALGAPDFVAGFPGLVRHCVPAVGADALAARAGGLGSAHAARTPALPSTPTTTATLSTSTTHDFLLTHAAQLAFDLFQLLAQHVSFFLEPAQLVLLVLTLAQTL